MKACHRTSYISLLRLISVLGGLLILTGCPKTDTIKSPDTADSAQYLLQQAQSAEGERRAEWMLEAAKRLLRDNRVGQSLEVLGDIDKDVLKIVNLQRYYTLMGQALIAAERPREAVMPFSRVRQADLLPGDEELAFRNTYADLLSALGRHFESAEQRMALINRLSDPLEVEENRELMWGSLLSLTNPSIYINSLNTMEVNGWLALAKLTKEFGDKPDQLLSALEVWQSRYIDHPANQQLPLDLARAQAAKAYQVKQLAIALPMSGRLAESAKLVRDGILTASYQAGAAKQLQIQFYDSTQSDIISIYQKAVSEGADFFIGPLERTGVESLAELEQFPIPVLTINTLSDERLTSSNFYQFGLPVEDEAIQAAQRARLLGHESALVLVPRSPLGERTQAAFAAEFERLGGEVRELIQYATDEDFDIPVQRLLSVDESFERMRRIREATGLVFEAEPRRRQDVDMVFIKADIAEARQIKPYLDFYNARDLPVMATSSVYNGREDPQLNRDLNRISFCDAPWLIEQSAELINLRRQVKQLWPRGSETNTARLFALGHDLFQIIPELNRLQNFPKYRLKGLTGSLTVDPQGRIIRELTWATIDRGQVKLLPPSSTLEPITPTLETGL